MDFIIISRDCFGNKYYKEEYNTTTIGSCMIFPEFIQYVKHISDIHNIQLTFDDNYQRILPECKYPIGLLRINQNIAIHIHYMHDTNKSEILNKYNRRINRMIKSENKNYLFFLNDLDFSKSNDLKYPRYFDITNEEINNGLIDYFSIEYGKKIFFCKQQTFNNLSKDVLNISNKGLIIIIPDNIKTGGEIYNYLIQSNKNRFIFGDEIGVIEL